MDADERLSSLSNLSSQVNAQSESTQTYEPRVQVTGSAQRDIDSFWERLVHEVEQADQAEAAGEPAVANFASAPAQPDHELTLDERCEKLRGVVCNKPSQREILIRTLSFCAQEHEFGEVEDVIQTYPEYPAAGQNPYRLITYLIDGGGLNLLEIDAAGAVLTPEQKTGLTEDEVDDLIDCFHLKTTEAGTKVAEEYSPARRIADLFSIFTDRVPFYTDLLDFCREPRTFKEIETLFAGRDLSSLRTLHPESGLSIKPTVFVDNMEKSGAIVWKDGGWVLTREGEAFLRIR